MITLEIGTFILVALVIFVVGVTVGFGKKIKDKKR